MLPQPDRLIGQEANAQIITRARCAFHGQRDRPGRRTERAIHRQLPSCTQINAAARIHRQRCTLRHRQLAEINIVGRQGNVRRFAQRIGQRHALGHRGHAARADHR